MTPFEKEWADAWKHKPTKAERDYFKALWRYLKEVGRQRDEVLSVLKKHTKP